MTSTEAHQKLLDLPGGLLSVCGPLEINIQFNGPGDLAAIGNALADHPYLGGTSVKVSETGTHTFTTSVALQAFAVVSLLEEGGFSIAEIDAHAVEHRPERPILIGPPGSAKSPAVAEMMRLYQSRVAQRAGAALPGTAGHADTASGSGLDPARADLIATVLRDVPEGTLLLEGDQDTGKSETARAIAKALGWEICEFRQE